MAVEGTECDDWQAGRSQNNKAIENPNGNRRFSHAGMMDALELGILHSNLRCDAALFRTCNIGSGG